VGSVAPAELEKTQDLSFHQYQTVLFAPNENGANKVGDVVTPSGPWATSWRFPVGVASSTRVANLWGNILDIWSNQGSWDLCMRRRSYSRLRLDEFLQLRT